MSGFMKGVANRVMNGFARRYDYDVGYMGEYAEASPGGFVRYLFAAPLMQYHKEAPAHVYFAAKAVATRRSDCGPCLRLVLRMAQQAGVETAVMRAALTGDPAILRDPVRVRDVEIAVGFANAVLDHDLIAVNELGDAILERWGRATLNEIAGAIAFGQFFPTFKRGLMHAQSCEPVLAELTAQA